MPRRRVLRSLSLGITLFALWALTHEYRGLVYDGQIYAVEALAKLRPALAGDLFLQNISQGQFTIFPTVYARFIALVGLEPAALLLTVIFSVWFLAAAWRTSALLFGRDHAWLTSFLLVITGGNYGASGVFRFLEPFLTARLAAEALIVTAIGLSLGGLEITGLVLAAGALFIHPLIALPGFLLLVCMRLPGRVRLTAAAIGLCVCLGAAVASVQVPAVGRLLPSMDVPWLQIVEERSQFLFLQLWTAKDWELNLRPFVCLALTLQILRDPRACPLARCALLVGATGLAIAAIASLIGPIALLVQGQAWRWVWITDLVSIVLLLPTARQLWTTDKWGTLCALLLVAGWAFPASIGFIYAVLALMLWVFRRHVWLRSDVIRRCALAIFIVSILAWTLIGTQDALASLARSMPNAHSAISSMKSVVGLRIWCVLIAAAAWYGIEKRQSLGPSIYSAIVLASISTLLVYDSFIHTKSFASATRVDEFADWRRAIPPAATVFVTNGHDSGSFVWFTLERNNYLSSGQSAGVVFSRATALEVRRRSEVLLPLVDPIWKMRTALSHPAGSPSGSVPFGHRTLGAQSLAAVCRDPALGFVVSPDDVGFNPIRHVEAGPYSNWNLYDCSRVRRFGPTS